VAPGVTAVASVDPFDKLEIYRIDRARWQHTPEQPGIYLLYGVNADGKLTVYIGMSTTNMRSRIRSHHIDPGKNWFGVLFSVPVPSALLCPAIEAELIGQVTEAGVVDVIANQAAERRHRDAEDVHIEPAVEKIRDGLQLVLGNDIFTPGDIADVQTTDPPLARMVPLAREYRGRAAESRPRSANDPSDATHGYVGAQVQAWALRGRGSRQAVSCARGQRLAQARPEPRGNDIRPTGRGRRNAGPARGRRRPGPGDHDLPTRSRIRELDPCNPRRQRQGAVFGRLSVAALAEPERMTDIARALDFSPKLTDDARGGFAGSARIAFPF